MISEALKKGHVIYRLANEVDYTYLQGTETPLTKNQKAEGFAFTNFLKTKSIIIQPDHFYIGNWDTVNDAIETGVFNSHTPSSEENTAKDDYDFGFRIIQNEIEYNKISKAVLSRKLVLNSPTECLTLFKNLADNYPSAHIFLIKLSNDEVWIGATPETLLKLEGDSCTTMSLAGTKGSEKDPWSQKEYDEQSIVTETILENLKGIDIDSKTEPLETIQAGPVYHLRNIIHFITDKYSAIDIAEQLHPTPAISGYPKSTAVSTIKISENHDREFYCGYSGPIKKDAATLFVNLRCAKISSNQITLFIGSGITKDSILENEWKECSRKAEAMLNFL